ncbi:MAG TPA: hypothetical protein VJ757_05655 [Pseudonocardiaceae bacterium]|nr:hypothetical protein [Pseudonocardiaceae bacterium]
MTPGRASHVAAVFTAAVEQRVELIRTTQYVVQVMNDIALTRENAAANYRLMAQREGPGAQRYLQLAEQFDHSAARARRFANQELAEFTKIQRLHEPDDSHRLNPNATPPRRADWSAQSNRCLRRACAPEGPTAGCGGGGSPGGVGYPHLHYRPIVNMMNARKSDQQADHRDERADAREAAADLCTRQADEREQQADHRDERADAREAAANLRERQADEREAQASEREGRLDHLAHRLRQHTSSVEERSREAITRTSAALERGRQRLDRSSHALDASRHQRDRDQWKIDRESSRSQRELDSLDGPVDEPQP